MSAVLASSTLRGSEPKHDRTATIGPREGVGLRILTLNVRSTYNSSALKTGIPTSEGGLTAVMAREVGDYILASGATVACLQNLNLHADEFEIISQRVGHQWEAVCSHEGKRETTPGVMSGLAVLSKLQDEQYGYSLKQSLDEQGMEINEGTLYPLLRRLESQGLLESDWQVVDDARPRRYYKMSQEGEMVFANLTQEWQALVVVMNQLLGLKTK